MCGFDAGVVWVLGLAAAHCVLGLLRPILSCPSPGFGLHRFWTWAILSHEGFWVESLAGPHALVLIPQAVYLCGLPRVGRQGPGAAGPCVIVSELFVECAGCFHFIFDNAAFHCR